MKNKLVPVALAVWATTYALTSFVDLVRDNRVAAAREATRSAVARADTALAAKALSDAAILQIVAEADTSIRKAQRAEARAVRANEEYTRLRRQLAETDPYVPPMADSALAAADSVITALRTSLGEQIEATAQLQAALVAEQAAHVQTANTLTELRTSATSLVKSTRPGLIGRFLPHTGVGIAVGLDVTGRPNAVVGMTVSLR